MTEISDEYTAGFFDGEGCVFLQTGGGLEVRIAQVDTTPLILIQEKYGGLVKPLAVSGNSCPCSQWRIMRWEEGVEFLRRIRPFLIVKAAQVDEVLTYFEKERLVDPLRFTVRGRNLTVVERMERQALRVRLSEMKGARSRRVA